MSQPPDGSWQDGTSRSRRQRPRRTGPNSYVVLWTQDRCKKIQRDGDRGPLSVLFGGPHTSLPSVRHLRPEDWIYPIALRHGRLYLIARVQIASIVPIYEYQLSDRFPACGHRAQTGCVDHAALGQHGTLLAFDREIPPDVVTSLRLGTKPGQEQSLRYLDDGGLLKHPTSLQGHYRRLSADSAILVDRLIHADDARKLGSKIGASGQLGRSDSHET